MKIIKHGTLVDSSNSYKADISFEDGKIIEIAESIEPKEHDEVFDATNCFVFPGFIDGHTHFDLDNGRCKTADDFTSGTKAAVVNGTTSVVDFALQEKGQTMHDAFDVWMKKAKGNSSCNYRFHMQITDWNERTRKELHDMPKLGVTSFKMYMAYDNLIADDEEILEALKEIKKIDGLLGVHCENGTLITALTKELLANGETTPAAHPKSKPDVVEAEAINRLAYISKLADHPVNVVHLSSLAGLNEIRYARNNGIQITAETCPQYLVLDDSVYNLPGFESAKYVLSPPIKKKKDQEALIQAIVDREIDTIATDHCSFYFKDKELGRDDFTKIPNGGPGVEDRVQLVYTNLVANNKIDISHMCELMCENPAKRFGMFPQKGILQPGSDADIVIFDPNQTKTISAATQVQAVDYNNYEGMVVKGQATSVFVNGVLVAKDGSIIKENQGTYVFGPKGEEHV